MPIMVLVSAPTSAPGKDTPSMPVGRYQFMPVTLDQLLRKLGISDTAMCNVALQDCQTYDPGCLFLEEQIQGLIR
jgi:hypothetical protein